MGKDLKIFPGTVAVRHIYKPANSFKNSTLTATTNKYISDI
jgi:hypothetical protein